MSNNKQRYVNTRFWNDTYVSVLDPIEKLLFIYLLTNEHTNISGVYELPFKIMAVETGIDSSIFKKILPRLKDRIRYIEGIVVVKNHIKHQETGSPNVMTGILNCLKDLDLNFLKNIVNKGYYILPKYYCDTLSIPYVEGRNYLDSNSNLDLHSNSITMSAKADAFNQFWEVYPKKELKKKSLEIWNKKKLDSSLEVILEFISSAKNTDRWKKGYIKQPTVFLNGECWNDDLSSYKDTYNSRAKSIAIIQ